jgi:hypothetical protein
MVRKDPTVDVSSMPDLARLAEEVARTGTSRRLQRDNKDLARLVPARRRSRRRRSTAPDSLTSLETTFGAWSGLVDGEQLKRELADAQSDSRPAAEL